MIPPSVKFELDENSKMHNQLVPYAPTILIYGPVADHDMPCPVLHGYKDELVTVPSEHSAVLSSGVFHPSWEAQRQGWRLIKLPTRGIKRVLLNWLLKDQYL